MVDAQTYLPRLADEPIEALISELPALMLNGPRATGKTTTARRFAHSVVQLDRPAEAEAFISDPDAALRELEEPVLFDEWQVVPGILGAIKRSVDLDPSPGRFLLTGSVRADLTAPTWPGTGRVVRLKMYGLTQREIVGNLESEPFLNRLAKADIDLFRAPIDPPDLVGYVDLAVRGGYPDVALGGSPRSGRAWLGSYVEQLLTRDVRELREVRDPALLRAYFEAVALNSAGVVSHRTLYDAVGLSRSTAIEYDRLFENLFVVEAVPPWSTNRLKRLSRTAKRYMVDPSLIAAALRIDGQDVIRDGDLLGRMIDTFVMTQIRAEVALQDIPVRLHHLREKDGRHEIDLIVDIGGQRVIALEIKSRAAPKREDAKHLIWLRDRLGDKLAAAAVLHTGPRPYVLDERIFALPIASFWN